MPRNRPTSTNVLLNSLRLDVKCSATLTRRPLRPCRCPSWLVSMGIRAFASVPCADPHLSLVSYRNVERLQLVERKRVPARLALVGQPIPGRFDRFEHGLALPHLIRTFP
jgi:hypothetical protein